MINKGPEISADLLNAIFRSFSVIFNEAFTLAIVDWPRVAMEVPSSGREVDYRWLAEMPSMREWVAERYIKDLGAYRYSLANKDWESTVGVDRNDILDDQIGVYRPLISEMGRVAAVHPDELIFGTLLPAGFATACFDGQFFFDTDHEVAGASVANYTAGASAAWYLLDVAKAIKPFIFQTRQLPLLVAKDKPNDENVFMNKKFLYGVDRRDNAGYGLWQMAYGSKATLDAAAYSAARAAMMSFKNDEGRPLGITPGLLVVPPSLEGAAREILLAERNAAGATNPWRNTAELLVSPWLS